MPHVRLFHYRVPKNAKDEITQALKYLLHSKNDWITPVLTCSAINNEGVKEIWDTIETYIAKIKTNNYFTENRNSQKISWMNKLLDVQLSKIFLKQNDIADELESAKNAVLKNKTLPTHGAAKIINIIKEKYNLKESRLYLAKDLEDDFMDLPEDKMIEILGMPINPENIETIDFGVLPEVLRHIMEIPLPNTRVPFWECVGQRPGHLHQYRQHRWSLVDRF